MAHDQAGEVLRLEIAVQKNGAPHDQIHGAESCHNLLK
jgi:hypothetical protein